MHDNKILKNQGPSKHSKVGGTNLQGVPSQAKKDNFISCNGVLYRQICEKWWGISPFCLLVPTSKTIKLGNYRLALIPFTIAYPSAYYSGIFFFVMKVYKTFAFKRETKKDAKQEQLRWGYTGLSSGTQDTTFKLYFFSLSKFRLRRLGDTIANLKAKS